MTRSTLVNIGGQYSMYESNSLGAYVHKQTWKGRGQIFTETRPDRDKRRKPTGWLYPRPYDLHVSMTRMNPNVEVITGRTGYKYVDGRPVKYEVRSLFTGNFLMDNIFVGGGAPLLPSDSNERKKAEISALLRLKEDRVNLGNALAEHKQTSKLVGDTFTAIARSFKYAKKANWKRAAKELKKQYKRNRRTDSPKIPKDWLAWQYGVKPLMDDVNGSIFALTTEHPLSDWILTVKGISVHKEKTTRHTGTGQFNSCTIVDEKFRGYFVRLDFHPRNDFLKLLNDFGVVNPLVPLWEITPWSFVIDWALPIGEWFETMDATFGLDFLSGSLTERIETKTRGFGDNRPLKNDGFVDGQWWIKSHHGLYGSQRALRLKRTVYTKPPIPLLPRYKNPVSATHVANGLSLLVATLTGGVPNFVRK